MDESDPGEPLELIRHPIDLGATPEQIEELDESDLIGLAGDLQLSAGLDLDLNGLAAAAGCRPEDARTIYELLGLPADQLAGFGEDDVKLVSLAAGDTTGFVERIGAPLFRVAGTAMARVAEAAVAAYVQDIEAEAARELDPIALADQNVIGSTLAVGFGEALSTVFRHHMWIAVRRQRSAQEGVVLPQVVRMAVGFVDMVGFTTLTRFASPAELLATVEEFERRAFDTAQRLGGRIVKSIGDEVMIAAPDAAAVAAIAHELLAEQRGDDSVQARAGVAAGDVLFRLGDYYGPVVNLASRLTNEALPDEVLADHATADAVGVEARPAGQRQLKGFAEPVEAWTVTGVDSR